MNAAGFAAVTLLVTLFGASPAGASLALNRQRDADRPVMKVVRLLQDMKVELEKERDNDNEVFEQIDCWCEKNEKEKTKAIDEAQARIADLDASHGEFFAKMGELTASLATTKAKLIEDQHALSTATALRMKENQEFHGEETDMLATIQSIKQALVVLSKHNPEFAQLRTVARSLQALKSLQLAKDTLGHEKMAALSAFLAESEESASSTKQGLRRAPFDAYSPQSGVVFGILKQLKEEFEGNLSQSQKAEAQAVEDFEGLKAAKEEELAAGTKQRMQLEQDLAEFGEKLAAAWQEMEDLKAQVKIDQEFLRNLVKRCAETDKEYEERTASRLQEIQAVDDTIAFLNSDRAFNNFGKTVNVGPSGYSSFLSLLEKEHVAVHRGRAVDLKQRQRAVQALYRAGAPELALLAESSQLDAFAEVKAAIDKMIAEMGRQQADEVKHRDWCVKEMNTNKRTTEKNYDEKASLETQIEDLTKTIEDLSKRISENKEAIVEMEAEMKKASETREAQNADYQQTVADQQITQSILNKAIARMRQVYALVQQEAEPENPGAAHTVLSGNHTDAGSAPARFKKYEKHTGGSRVVDMMETILKDAVTMMNEAIAAEEDAASAYDNFMQESNRSIAQYLKGIATMTEAKAKGEQDLDMAKTDLAATLKTLEGLNNELGDLKISCDFLLRNFDSRQQARAFEIQALREAKAILSGME